MIDYEKNKCIILLHYSHELWIKYLFVVNCNRGVFHVKEIIIQQKNFKLIKYFMKIFNILNYK